MHYQASLRLFRPPVHHFICRKYGCPADHCCSERSSPEGKRQDFQAGGCPYSSCQSAAFWPHCSQERTAAVSVWQRHAPVCERNLVCVAPAPICQDRICRERSIKLNFQLSYVLRWMAWRVHLPLAPTVASRRAFAHYPAQPCFCPAGLSTHSRSCSYAIRTCFCIRPRHV